MLFVKGVEVRLEDRDIVATELESRRDFGLMRSRSSTDETKIDWNILFTRHSTSLK
jgi:hypothetical protein